MTHASLPILIAAYIALSLWLATMRRFRRWIDGRGR